MQNYGIYLLVLVYMLAPVCAESHTQQQQWPEDLQPEARSIIGKRERATPQHPYLFLSVPRGRNGAFSQGFQVIEVEDDDDDNHAVNYYDDDIDVDSGAMENDADDDDDDNEPIDDDDDDIRGNSNIKASIRSVITNKYGRFGSRIKYPKRINIVRDADNDDAELIGVSNIGNDDVVDDDEDNRNDNNNDNNDDSLDNDYVNNEFSVDHVIVPQQQAQKIIKNAKRTQMMVAREHTGAIMVPDGVIEVEGQSVLDEKTGKTALLVPRAALDAIPDGSVVALMERNTNALRTADQEEEERANRVIVRRRRKGGRRNVRRRNPTGRRRSRIGGGGNRRRRLSNRNSVRIIRAGGTKFGIRSRSVRRGDGNIYPALPIVL